MKKKLWKQWRFWLEVVLGLLVVFFAFATFSLASELNKREKTKADNSSKSNVTKNYIAYAKRFLDEEHKDTVVDFILSPKYGFEFGETVTFESGDFVVKFAKVDDSGLITTTQDYKNKIIVALSFDNTSDDEAIIDTKDFFPVLKNGTYPEYDSLILDEDETVEVDDSIITVSAGAKTDFAIIYGTDEDKNLQPINVRMGESLWKK